MAKPGTNPSRHLGLRLDEDAGRKLNELVADETKKVGHFASVSYATLVIGLIHAEYERRGLGAAPKASKK